MRPIALLIGLLASGLVTDACNPFTDKRGQAGQPCLDDGVCNQGLVCLRQVCVEVIDCLASPPDCSRAGPEGQGPDYDGDSWELLAPLNGDAAADTAMALTSTVIPYEFEFTGLTRPDLVYFTGNGVIFWE